ncbi:MAG: recombination mediator RecR [Holosporales bacterium]|jgi:recombination protein RecR|nr:recombination mediator RecR [Holosporales bacterium]
MSFGEIDKLVSCIGRLPGIGIRSAVRIVVHLLRRRDSVMVYLIRSLTNVYEKSKKCEVCGNIDVKSPCFVCSDRKRDDNTICIVSDVSDLWAIERAGFYRGRYHVLGGKLSAFDGIRPEDVDIDKLKRRIIGQVSGSGEVKGISEVIIAMSADLDGQTTMFFVKDKIKELSVKVTTLSNGVPIGSDIEGLDDGTIIAAFKQRHDI